MSSTKKPIIIGLYGISGSGKSFLLDTLKNILAPSIYAFYEGSDRIAALTLGGLEAFQRLSAQDKDKYRTDAIDQIQRECAASGKVGIVVSDFLCWVESEEAFKAVNTKNDLRVFTHILYVDIPPFEIFRQRNQDSVKKRPSMTITLLTRWQNAEQKILQRECYAHGILLSFINPKRTPTERLVAMLEDFRIHNETLNSTRIKTDIRNDILKHSGNLEIVVILDGDKTLAAADSGALFCQKTVNFAIVRREVDPLKTLFSSNMGYSYTAFRQAMLLYEEAETNERFEEKCTTIAAEVNLYPEIRELICFLGTLNHVAVLIVTCGLRRVWEKVIQKEGFSNTVRIFGGGRIDNGYVVTSSVKAEVVRLLQDDFSFYTFAFGGSPLDVNMLKQADEAFVVMGSEETRSNFMRSILYKAYDKGLQASQVLLSTNANERLDPFKFSEIDISGSHFRTKISNARRRRPRAQLIDATPRSATKLLMIETGDSTLEGPALREAHRRVGWYLATEFVTEVVGLQQFTIRNTQNEPTMGYRLLHERQTLIVAIMRGGEPMAFGVNDAFPLATFIHAQDPEAIKPEHVKNMSTVILVDAVVNSGKTMKSFVQQIRCLHATIHIVVVIGVLQAKSEFRNENQMDTLTRYGKLSIVALRVSDNSYIGFGFTDTGFGFTDTGNRLFNTTHLP